MKVNGVQNNNRHWATFQNISLCALQKKKNIKVYNSSHIYFIIFYKERDQINQDIILSLKQMSMWTQHKWQCKVTQLLNFILKRTNG